jgi:hypothetical protein
MSLVERIPPSQDLATGPQVGVLLQPTPCASPGFVVWFAHYSDAVVRGRHHQHCIPGGVG